MSDVEKQRDYWDLGGVDGIGFEKGHQGLRIIVRKIRIGSYIVETLVFAAFVHSEYFPTQA